MSSQPIAETISQGGRAGSVETHNKGFNLKFAEPSDTNPEGLTPEHLFGAAWAACFHGAVLAVAKAAGHELVGSTVTAVVQWKQSGDQPFDVELRLSLPGLDEDEAEKIVHKAEKMCAYSNATRGRVGFKTVFN